MTVELNGITINAKGSAVYRLLILAAAAASVWMTFR